MAVKQPVLEKTVHANSMELFVLTFAWVAEECSA